MKIGRWPSIKEIFSGSCRSESSGTIFCIRKDGSAEGTFCTGALEKKPFEPDGSFRGICEDASSNPGRFVV
ncbi:MAG: hypothetical protein PUD44_07820 [Clostridiaceae bacterium]|nr:hypothetical protein [Clostridiaceae bacterium]